jgi:hypothetical protein
MNHCSNIFGKFLDYSRLGGNRVFTITFPIEMLIDMGRTGSFFTDVK